VALSALSEAEYRMGAWDEAVVDGELAASTARDTGQTWLAPFLHSVASYPLAGRGDWNLTEAHVHAAQAAARVSGGPAMIAYAALGEAYLARARGRTGGL
jgi:hypothetical protein